jgi:hypothetical protein
MTKIDLKFAELHAPLFLAGTNLQLKLDPTRRTGLKLVYDRAEKELLVTWQNQLAIVPVGNVASMTPAGVEVAKPEPMVVVEKARPRVTAQVSTPQSHVHAGPGHGDTGQGKGKVVL